MSRFFRDAENSVFPVHVLLLGAVLLLPILAARFPENPRSYAQPCAGVVKMAAAIPEVEAGANHYAIGVVDEVLVQAGANQADVQCESYLRRSPGREAIPKQTRQCSGRQEGSPGSDESEIAIKRP